MGRACLKLNVIQRKVVARDGEIKMLKGRKREQKIVETEDHTEKAKE